jgi:hypothetical protein
LRAAQRQHRDGVGATRLLRQICGGLWLGSPVELSKATREADIDSPTDIRPTATASVRLHTAKSAPGSAIGKTADLDHSQFEPEACWPGLPFPSDFSLTRAFRAAGLLVGVGPHCGGCSLAHITSSHYSRFSGCRKTQIAALSAGTMVDLAAPLCSASAIIAHVVYGMKHGGRSIYQLTPVRSISQSPFAAPLTGAVHRGLGREKTTQALSSAQPISATRLPCLS